MIAIWRDWFGGPALVAINHVRGSWLWYARASTEGEGDGAGLRAHELRLPSSTPIIGWQFCAFLTACVYGTQSLCKNADTCFPNPTPEIAYHPDIESRSRLATSCQQPPPWTANVRITLPSPP